MTQAREDRRLMAILFTDVAGYTALTERDEATAIRVRERHRTLVQTLTGQFEGELIDSTGDEALAIFPSALHAVDCALALQAALRADRDFAIRIGIRLGDVVRRGVEVIGEGVNVAARIRPLAEPGGIAVSESVYQAVRTRPHIHVTSLGAKALKNVSQPVNVFAVSSEPQPKRPARGRARWLALTAALLVALGAGVWFQFRVPIITSLALALPRWFGDPIEQRIGFAQTSDGVRIAYATTGAGPPIVLVLGWATHLERGVMSPMYDRFGWIAQMSERNTLVRYDGRGFGMSQRDATDFSLDARVRDIEAVVDALGLERFTLYGLSAGGPAAIAYAARHPERVSGLILASTLAGNASVRGAGIVSKETWWGVIDLVRTSWSEPAVREMFVSVVFSDTDAVERGVWSEFLAIASDGAAIAGFFGASRAEDVSAIAEQVRVPTLVLHGDRDVTVPLPFGAKLAALIPGARLEILKGAGHHEVSTDPRARKLVDAFLAEGG